MSRFIASMCIAGFAAIGLAGCAASPEEAEAARLQPGTPLAHDPTDPFELGPWWSDGSHLLNLRADGGYSLYDGNNRYTRPIDRGRWGQQNYGTLWLMPYGGNEPQRIRVAITRIDGRLALQPPRYDTMFEIAAPPSVMEDRLLGQWRGAIGSLTLERDSTYAFVPSQGATTADGKALAGHNGKWSLKGEQLTLTPATPSVPAITFKVHIAPPPPSTRGAAPVAAPEPVLEGLGGELVHVTNASA